MIYYYFNKNEILQKTKLGFFKEKTAKFYLQKK